MSRKLTFLGLVTSKTATALVSVRSRPMNA
jgi:hypothetical protein